MDAFLIWKFLFVSFTFLVDLSVIYCAKCPHVTLLNGQANTRSKGKTIHFECNKNFRRVGARFAVCLPNGQWSQKVPYCVGHGCPKIGRLPHLRIRKLYKGRMLKFTCSDAGYRRSGPETIMCNGKDWNEQPPKCIAGMSLGCDFEDESLCGWSHDSDFKWIWHSGQTPTGGTGPTVDHTTNTSSGHYLFMESSAPTKPGYKARIASPLYQPKDVNDFCLQFFYHMFGSPGKGKVGELFVYTRPMSSDRKKTTRGSVEMFLKEGNQGDQWLQADAKIPKHKEPFRLVFQATRLRGWASDIAIDDIRLYNCSQGLTTIAPTQDSQDVFTLIGQSTSRTTRRPRTPKPKTTRKPRPTRRPKTRKPPRETVPTKSTSTTTSTSPSTPTPATTTPTTTVTTTTTTTTTSTTTPTTTSTSSTTTTSKPTTKMATSITAGRLTTPTTSTRRITELREELTTSISSLSPNKSTYTSSYIIPPTSIHDGDDDTDYISITDFTGDSDDDDIYNDYDDNGDDGEFGFVDNSDNTDSNYSISDENSKSFSTPFVDYIDNGDSGGDYANKDGDNDDDSKNAGDDSKVGEGSQVNVGQVKNEQKSSSSSATKLLPLILGVVAAVVVLAVVIAIWAYMWARNKRRKQEKDQEEMNIITEYADTTLNI